MGQNFDEVERNGLWTNDTKGEPKELTALHDYLVEALTIDRLAIVSVP